MKMVFHDDVGVNDDPFLFLHEQHRIEYELNDFGIGEEGQPLYDSGCDEIGVVGVTYFVSASRHSLFPCVALHGIGRRSVRVVVPTRIVGTREGGTSPLVPTVSVGTRKLFIIQF